MGVPVPWALMYTVSSGCQPASSRASWMALAPQVPSGRGAVMWKASQVAP